MPLQVPSAARAALPACATCPAPQPGRSGLTASCRVCHTGAASPLLRQQPECAWGSDRRASQRRASLPEHWQKVVATEAAEEVCPPPFALFVQVLTALCSQWRALLPKALAECGGERGC